MSNYARARARTRTHAAYATGAAVVSMLAAGAGATTLMRASLDNLTAGNSTIVVGEVIETYPYWNADGTMILTDVRVLADDIVKGQPIDPELTVTILGGTVGDTTVLIPGGPQLERGRSYVLFLNREDLPGSPGSLTLRDHSQGVFDLRVVGGKLRALSQARDLFLVPDGQGLQNPPGGSTGLDFELLLKTIDGLADDAGEVSR